MNWARLHPRYRREYRRALAMATPLIDGHETKALARAMRYDADLLQRIADDAAHQVAEAKKVAERFDVQIRQLSSQPHTGRTAKAIEKLREQRERELARVYDAGEVPMLPRETYPSRLQAWIRNCREVLHDQSK